MCHVREEFNLNQNCPASLIFLNVTHVCACARARARTHTHTQREREREREREKNCVSVNATLRTSDVAKVCLHVSLHTHKEKGGGRDKSFV